MGRETAYIVVGKIGAPHGVRGWVKVHSYTEPVDNLFDYDPWYMGSSDRPTEWREAPVLEAQEHGKAVIAHFKGCNDRDAAAEMRGLEIAIRRDQLPPTAEGEYYWVDLVGLKVLTLDGVDLGTVEELMATGANDVLVVKGERQRLIPYVLEHIVKEVDIKGGVMRVDWDPEFE